MPDVLARTVRDAGRGLVFWTAGIVLLVVVTVSIYPSIEGNTDLTNAVEDYPEELTAFFGGELDFASGAGYLNGELYSLMVPLLLLVYGIGAGARAIAGEEEAGTLDLLLSHPLRRRRVLLEKLGAAVALLAVLGVIVFLAVTLSSAVFGLDVGTADVAAATLGAVLLAALFATLALLVGSATGSRALAIGVAASLVIASYLLYGLANLVDALEPVGSLAPWDWYAGGDPLRNGPDWSGTTLLLASILVLAGAAIPLFDRRDLST
jgi:beta-exotoxin I transport system permease protein